ncbi:hypothetical protein AZI86_17550 [Bdellovibrio bacteriovorus]|uniref:Uncharacterized protein n=1 Tax=Bdellovibrio bacteriovorus TaxID=959 RepID=A0A150WF07_BDEBC|nr:hypothetical protein [Bdellovibrio bacteriovorus]KYG61513.1 hypothetical protein AZI86_17550 [Bdellovibrio bacteriovorus]
MKSTLRNTILSLMFVLAWVPAWAQTLDESLTVTEVEEKVLEVPKLSEEAKADKILIRVSDDRVFEVDTVPNVEEMKAALGLILPDKVKAEILARGGVIEDVNPMEAYDQMSAEDKAKFKEARMHFLSNAARILTSSRMVLGAGSLVGDAFSFVTVKVKKAFGKEVDQGEKVRRTFSERSYQAVQSALKGIDYKLWNQAPMVIDSNEFGLSLSLGIVAETGVLKKGGGGAEEIGISLAVNKSKRAFVFEIFHNSESFDNTKAAISVLGVVGKAGMTMGHREDARTLKGSSFYPPAVPGFSTTSSEFFAAGFSSSLGLPPPPLADLMTFTNKFERHVWIRVTVSPMVKGFVRVQFGDVRGSMKLVAMRFVDVFHAISDKVVKLAGKNRRCSAVFQ